MTGQRVRVVLEGDLFHANGNAFVRVGPTETGEIFEALLHPAAIVEPASGVLTHLETVFIEGNPFSGVTEPMLDHQYDTLPQPFLDVLFDLPGFVDHIWCARCDCLTGFVVAAQRFDGGDQVEWQPTALVREPDGPVAVLCADCAPYVPDSPATHSVGAA